MAEPYPEICLSLPGWVTTFVKTWDEGYSDEETRMRFVIALARENARRGTGGPFGAAVFAMDGHRLVAPGVNLVTNYNVSCAHAEMVALTVAQSLAGCFDLSQCGEFELVTSTEPCAMCLGAVPWSGVRRLVCGATGGDAEAIGFDEGAKPAKWVAALAERGIRVSCEVEREAARAVLDEYAGSGGVIYSPARSN